MAVPGGTPPGYPGGYAPQPRVRFEAIGEAWQYLQPQLGTWVIATLVYFICIIVVNVLVGMVVGALGFGASQAARSPGLGAGVGVGAFMGANMVGAIAGIVIGFFFLCGMYRMATKQMRGEPISVGDIFSVTDVMGSIVVGALLHTILTAVSLMLCVIPAFFVIPALSFTHPLIADRRLDGVAAISESFNTLKSDFLMMFLLLFVLGLINIAGAIPCGLGLFVTIPLTILTISVLYRDYFMGMPQPGNYPSVPTGYPPSPGAPPPPAE